MGNIEILHWKWLSARVYKQVISSNVKKKFKKAESKSGQILVDIYQRYADDQTGTKEMYNNTIRKKKKLSKNKIITSQSEWPSSKFYKQ